MKTAWMGNPDAVPWTAVEDRPGVHSRFLGENSEDGPWVVQVKFEPHSMGQPHWHEADTVYIVTQGAMSFGGDMCHAGELRWCRAGYYYGPETAGPEGCEFFLIGSGNLTSASQLGPRRDRAAAKGLAEA
jgi:hypothetical protein